MPEFVRDGDMILINETTRAPYHTGDMVADFRGAVMVLHGGYSPRKSGSTGRIFVSDGMWSREFFPGVIGAVWVTACRRCGEECPPEACAYAG